MAVTGATGFIGRHLVSELLERGHEIIAVGRSRERFLTMDWASKVCFEQIDIDEPDPATLQRLVATDCLLHLAWPGLPNYQDRFHFERNLPAAYRWIQAFVDEGCRNVLVTGTCFEYGAREGKLSEWMPVEPTNSYALGKDCLHRFLRILQTSLPFQLTWARLFYTYGAGQNPGSLIAQLDAAIDRGEDSFAMSGGEQIRDYLPVNVVARHLAMLAEKQDFDGTVNICSGEPISVRRLVEQHCAARNAEMTLQLGHYPYPDYEPLAMWGDPSLLQSLEQPR
ncbi:NAD-dependent epimerase/dehydratase family protein [Allorhodopirellula solitaria]|uniref:dTDP-6-deoxy-L-talose 4-dehydrogenase (NAD(+)) n=1 Tax=Allorhodopirellula solitaria TaxID=2527987 RepID=A0A5C5X291_9BACT|nr:NAD(P)-dependent oxidoreductase [Allorhodopirellula solitaria]TWT56352.1 dTDP-6-deoxy-L-talose 4-dehydrogenase (NAD(+)) [Allorhodopirellula solitaria]